MTDAQAQVALILLKATWASLPQAWRDKATTFAIEQAKGVALAEIHSFIDSLPHAGPEPAMMDASEAGRMLGNLGQDQ